MEMFFAYYLWTIIIVVFLIYTHNTGFGIPISSWMALLVAAAIPGVNVLVVLGLLLSYVIN